MKNITLLFAVSKLHTQAFKPYRKTTNGQICQSVKPNSSRLGCYVDSTQTKELYSFLVYQVALIKILTLKRASRAAQLIKNLPAMQETPVHFLGQEDPLEKGQATHSSILGLPRWLRWSRICLQWGRPWFDPCVGKIPWKRERLSTPVFWPENSMDCTVHGVAKSQTRLRDFHFSFTLKSKIIMIMMQIMILCAYYVLISMLGRRFRDK